jgi:hypothetical protein
MMSTKMMSGRSSGRGDHDVALALEQRLRGAADGLAVVDDHHLDSGAGVVVGCFRHVSYPQSSLVTGCPATQCNSLVHRVIVKPSNPKWPGSQPCTT